MAPNKAPQAVLTNASLLRTVFLFQRGLPRDMVELLSRSRELHPNSTLARLVVRLQDLRMLERLWRYSQEQPEYFSQQPKLTFDSAWLESLRVGNVEITTWIEEYAFKTGELQFDQVWMGAIQSRKRVEIAEYATTRFPQLKKQIKEKHVVTAIIHNAADFLQWLDTNVENVPYPPRAPSSAVNTGAIDILEHLHERSPSQAWPRGVMDLAARLGQLEMIRFLHENRTDGCTTVAMDQAAANGHLEIIRFLHEHHTEGCTTAAMNLAAANGHLEVVQ